MSIHNEGGGQINAFNQPGNITGNNALFKKNKGDNRTNKLSTSILKPNSTPPNRPPPIFKGRVNKGPKVTVGFDIPRKNSDKIAKRQEEQKIEDDPLSDFFESSESSTDKLSWQSKRASNEFTKRFPVGSHRRKAFTQDELNKTRKKPLSSKAKAINSQIEVIRNKRSHTTKDLKRLSDLYQEKDKLKSEYFSKKAEGTLKPEDEADYEELFGKKAVENDKNDYSEIPNEMLGRAPHSSRRALPPTPNKQSSLEDELFDMSEDGSIEFFEPESGNVLEFTTAEEIQLEQADPSTANLTDSEVETSSTPSKISDDTKPRRRFSLKRKLTKKGMASSAPESGKSRRNETLIGKIKNRAASLLPKRKKTFDMPNYNGKELKSMNPGELNELIAKLKGGNQLTMGDNFELKISKSDGPSSKEAIKVLANFVNSKQTQYKIENKTEELNEMDQTIKLLKEIKTK